MDEQDFGEVGGGGGGGGDPGEQFHGNEAISAVVDEGFLGEEDDDYEDLYNDVNVGEGFLQSLRKNEESGFRNEEEEVEKKPEVPPQAFPPLQTTSAVADVSNGARKFANDDVGSGRVDANLNAGFRANEAPGGRGSGLGGPGEVVATGGGVKVELGQPSGKVGDVEDRVVNTNGMSNQGIGQQPHTGSAVPMGNVGSIGNIASDGLARQVGGGSVNGPGGSSFGNGSGGPAGGMGVVGGGGGGGAGGGGSAGGTILFVGDLHWWTTDAELEGELCKYGHVKEVKFFDEKASGKSKGYCQVEFYDPSAATACKEGMNGHVFNGRPCVVAFASPYSVKRMGEAQVNRNQQMAQTSVAQARRGTGDAPAKTGPSNVPTGGNFQSGGNYQGGGESNRGFGRGNWGRGNAPGMGGRGPMGPGRGRGGGMGGRGLMGNGGGGFGQNLGATPPMLHPQSLMGQGFDPAFGGPMGRMGGYGGFPGGPTPPFSGLLPSFPPVGNVGLPGVAPHLNPAFFGRGMPMGGMGMMPTSGVDGPNMGMWPDPNMAGWGGEEHGGRVGESSYGEEAISDHQFGEVSHDRGGWPNAAKEKDRGSEREWSGSTDKRFRDEREPAYERDAPREKDVGHDHDWPERRHREERDTGRDRERERDRERSRDRDRDRDRDRERDRERDRDRHRDERDRYADHHRYREREPEYEDEWDRGRSSRSHTSKSRLSQDEEQRSRSRDADYGKRRRLTSE